jgi:DNA-binding transcriptional MerR regulator
MKTEKKIRTTKALKEIGVPPRTLVLWENTNKLFKIERDPKSKNKDRIWRQDDIEMVKWVKKQYAAGLSSDAIRLLIEYYRSGCIESIKWYK